MWEQFGGDRTSNGSAEEKVATLDLTNSGKCLFIVKDLSELKAEEKQSLFADLAAAVAGKREDVVYLVAANDGQLVASWRDWAEPEGTEALADFKVLEGMLVEGRSHDQRLRLCLYNLSRMDAADHFDALIEQVVEHPQWQQCEGCELLNTDGSTTCPIRLNRALLRGETENSPFRQRLSDLLRLAGTNRMHLPIRDLLLLGINIILGDQQRGQPSVDMSNR